MASVALADRRTGYAIRLAPVARHVSVEIAGQVIADSDAVIVMHETHLPPTYYFPPSDVATGILVPSPRRTFCPFKGNASHWSIETEQGVRENVAWSYQTPLEESAGVKGYFAFYESAVDVWREDGVVMAGPAARAGGRQRSLAEWLLTQAPQQPGPAELTAALGRQLALVGIPVSRAHVGIWTLDPQLAGRSYRWRRGDEVATTTPMKHGVLQSAAYLNSPVRLVAEGAGGVRQRLTERPLKFDFPLLRTLQAEGATDYVAMPLPYSNGQINTLSLATDHPDGFTTAQLGQVFEALFNLARLYEVFTVRRNTSDLLHTYLGRFTGDLVLGGLTRRGDGRDIRAAIWYCDLRGSTRRAASLPRPAYMELLNRFFDLTAGAVIGQGGEVLKFVGDAVLGIFPAAETADGPAEACRLALEAARTVLAGRGAASAAGEPLDCAIGIHFGDVTYGNVGSARRLDFTVIGAAANEVVWLSDLGKEMDQAVLVAEAVAALVPDGLRPLEQRAVKGSGAIETIYALVEK